DAMLPNSATPVVDTLTLEGQSSTATLNFEHDSSSTISSLKGVVAKQFSNYEFQNGKLVTPRVEVQANAQISGSGQMEADLMVGMAAAGGGEAMVSPGQSSAALGTLNVNGDLHLGSSATLLFDVEGVTQFDRLNVTGDAELSGTLRIDATNLTMPAPGTTFEIIATGSLAAGEYFDA